MAKIYSVPEKIIPPVFDYKNILKSQEDEKRYIKEVKEYCIENTNTKNEYVGEMITIPHADGKACYIVFSTKPLELIHLHIGDAWDSPYADLLTTKRVKEMVDGNKKLKDLNRFSTLYVQSVKDLGD